MLNTCIVVFLLKFFLVYALGSYRICNYRREQEEIRSAVDSNVRQLMDVRLVGWGWGDTSQVVVSLQISKPRGFFGRNNTVHRMGEDLTSNFNNLSVGQLGSYLLAVQSACRNPSNFVGVNLPQKIRNLLHQQWKTKSQIIPSNGWFEFGLAHLALCIHERELPKNFPIERIVIGQNADGSFGNHSVKATSKVILMLGCFLRRIQEVQQEGEIQGSNQLFSFEQKARLLIKKATLFLKANVQKDNNFNTWIGDKHSTPYALLALNHIESYQRLEKSKCLQVVRSLASSSDESDKDEEIAMRLLALSGRNFFYLLKHQDCNETDPIPPGYYPGRKNTTLLCRSFLYTNDLPRIQIRLSVQTGDSWNLNGPYVLSLNLTKIREGSTLLRAMEHAQCFKEFKFKYVFTDFGPFLKTVHGVKANSSRRQYWSLIDVKRGCFLTQGLIQIIPEDGDHILIQLATF